MNKRTNIISLFNEEGNKIVSKKGLWLLEHFRCPLEIFNILNKFFYNNKLIYKKQINENKCKISSFLENELPCAQNSYIQIEYDENTKFPFKEKENVLEIIIGLKFIVENLENFYDHCTSKIKKDIYLKNNVVFVIPYLNQRNLFEKIIEELHMENEINKIILNSIKPEEKEKVIHILKNIGYGTIDSLQGIGADFIIYSNVSSSFLMEKEENKKEVRVFEFDKNRVNVLFSRTKQHFIEIIHKRYWDGFDSEKYNTKEHQWAQGIKQSIDKNEDKTIIKIELDNNFKFKVNYFQDNKTNITFKIGKEA